VSTWLHPITALHHALVLIGWISTYEREGRTEHIAPYSFFTDVARGKQPIAISLVLVEAVVKKDAQKDWKRWVVSHTTW
jgi:hypothetical protein